MAAGERDTSKPYLRGRIWWIRYSVNGEEICESSKSTEKRDAVRLLNQRRTEKDRGSVGPTVATIGNLLDLYVAEKSRTGQAQIAEGYARLHLRPAFEKTRVKDFTTATVNRFIEQKRLKPYSNASINRWLEGLQRAFVLGREHVPPMVIEIPKIPMLDERTNVREGFIDADEYRRILKELPEHQRLLLVLAYHLGMRRGELLKLRWEQVDWKAGLIRLEATQTKGKQARIAPLYGDLRPFLELAFSDPNRGETIISFGGKSMSETKTAWKSATLRAGLPNVLLHDMRRSAIRNLMRSGLSQKVAKKITGHKTDSIFERYFIIDENDVLEAGRMLDASFERVHGSHTIPSIGKSERVN